MSKFFKLTTLMFLILITPVFLLGYGVQQGTTITNARDLDGNNTADNPGEVVATYSNGATALYAKATNITICTVAAGYDLSVINNPDNGTNAPGTYVEYTYFITNRANTSAQMIVRISSNNSTLNWGAASYELWTNFGGGFGLLSGPASFLSNQLISVPADSGFQLRVRVNIPSTAGDGATNEFLFEIWDPAGDGTPGVGDAWPTSLAIAPATPDIANARDYQSDYVTTVVAGPVIQLVKSIDITSAKPYEVLTYTIHYTNAGSGNAIGVVIDDVLDTTLVQILPDSAETNNTLTHNPTNFYYDGTTWQDATYDTPGTAPNIQRIRWQLRNPVGPNESGNLEFKVIIK